VTTTETTKSAINGQLAPEWREWVAENLLLQVPAGQILDSIVSLGFSGEAARAEIDAVRSDPCWRAGERAAQRLRKLESLLDIHQALDTLDGRPFAIDRLGGLSRRDFLERYYARNRPVVMLGLTDGWPAHTEWTPLQLKERLGHVEVEVQSERDADELYELHSNEHKRLMRFGDYIDRVLQGNYGNDLYLTANNHFFERPDTATLLADFMMPTEYLDPKAPPGTIFLWFGPRGTVTPLHHDIVNILFVQVQGRKHITLIPSLQTHRVYNNIGVYSQVDFREPDFDQYPRLAKTTPVSVVVEPGETLFIPVGWWHYVEALDTCISLSFTNFVFPNNYAWEHPSLDR
jgi:ribosomal protein L16 Arg81 hydroxylase